MNKKFTELSDQNFKKLNADIKEADLKLNANVSNNTTRFTSEMNNTFTRLTNGKSEQLTTDMYYTDLCYTGYSIN